MPRPPGVAFRLDVALEDADQALATLSDLGTTGMQELDNDGGAVRWIVFFPEASAELERSLARLGTLAPYPIPDVDWVARFRENFTGFDAGGFRVEPEWNRDAAPAGPRTLIVDPGQAFGTGTHETTRLCLAALVAAAEARPLGRLLDLGTGSGILAIAAERLGATLAVGIDFDPDAVISARKHVQLNASRVHLAVGDLARPLRARFDTVIANLMAPLLVERRLEIQRTCAPSGRLILSGLLRDDLPLIRSHFGTQSAETTDGEWAAVAFGGVA